MLIKESQLNTVNNFTANLLENMDYLTESESAYYPAMVPVVENTRLGAYTIALEDMCQFAESNGIVDFGYALQTVCEASEISPANVVFSVHEEGIIADDSMAELVAGIMNEGVTVVAVPLSQSDPANVFAEMAIMESLNNDDDSLLEAYANNDWDVFAEAKAQTFDPNPQAGNKYTDMRRVQHAQGAEMARDNYDDGPDTSKDKPAAATGNPEADLSKLEWIKQHAYNQPKDWFSSQIAALNGCSQRVQGRIANVPKAQRGIFQKLKTKIASIIEFLTRKMHNLISSGPDVKRGTKKGMKTSAIRYDNEKAAAAAAKKYGA